MVWCPLCGEFWLIKTGQRVLRSIMGRSSNDIVDEPPEVPCPRCEP